MEVVRHLVTEIGTRLSGSASEEAAARYLTSKFEQIGLEVELERYTRSAAAKEADMTSTPSLTRTMKSLPM